MRASKAPTFVGLVLVLLDRTLGSPDAIKQLRELPPGRIVPHEVCNVAPYTSDRFNVMEGGSVIGVKKNNTDQPYTGIIAIPSREIAAVRISYVNQKQYEQDISYEIFLGNAVDDVSGPTLTGPVTEPIPGNNILVLNFWIAATWIGPQYIVAKLSEPSDCVAVTTIGQITATSAYTAEPTSGYTPEPTAGYTPEPTAGYTPQPTKYPTSRPTFHPIPIPTRFPTPLPTKYPTYEPTKTPTYKPTQYPTYEPTKTPTYKPTQYPTYEPTNHPTYKPTAGPTQYPTSSPATSTPTAVPTSGSPTSAPTVAPRIVTFRITDMTLYDIDFEFQLKVKRGVADVLKINVCDFEIYYTSGSIVGNILFTDAENAADQAESLSNLSEEELGAATGTNIDNISEPSVFVESLTPGPTAGGR